MSNFRQTIISLDLLHTSLYRMKLFINAHAVKNAKTAVISLISRLEKAELERDELRAIAEEQSKLADSNAARAQKAEAEIARRDAAAGEPVAVLYRNGDVLTKAECGEYFEICCKVETPLYTAAPPALLPPAVMKHLSDAANTVSEWTHGDEHSCKVSRTALIAAIEALGAQPQKPVICPPVQYLSKYAADDGHCTTGKLVPNKRTELRDTDWREALDAAGVKWEVKK